MIKFKASSKDYASMDDFKQACFNRFELVKKELNALLGVDCNIELSSFSPQFSKNNIYHEAWNLSSKDFEYVMSFESVSRKFDKTSIGMVNVSSIGLDNTLSLNKIALHHIAVGKTADEDRSYAGIRIVYSVSDTCADVSVKYASDVSDGALSSAFTKVGSLISIVDESTSILKGFKESRKVVDVQLA